jgi:hypothetical protein
MLLSKIPAKQGITAKILGNRRSFGDIMPDCYDVKTEIEWQTVTA